ncbi:hypothetical protein QT995_16665 [Microcoleus sp. S36b_A3]|uniref:hypothetical protein n=1 Tax=unclassified Microcoleus TaxID=2642155 RepID=UPI002FD18F64
MAMGKQQLPALYILTTATHHPHRIFGTVGNTDDTSPDARAVQNGRGKLMAFP